MVPLCREKEKANTKSEGQNQFSTSNRISMHILLPTLYNPIAICTMIKEEERPRNKEGLSDVSGMSLGVAPRGLIVPIRVPSMKQYRVPVLGTTPKCRRGLEIERLLEGAEEMRARLTCATAVVAGSHSMRVGVPD